MIHQFCCRVGYAACHWCHVMAHESFEDEATAAYLNEHFVSIKVDREERPDVDAVYMQATTSMTGHGGWPMTVRARPRREPVLRRHLLPGPAAARAAVVPAGAGGAGRRVDEPAATRYAGWRATLREHLNQQVAASRRGAITARACSTVPCSTLAREFDAAHARLRRRPEVPAVDGAGVPAAARRATRPCRCSARPSRRWRAAGSTTSSAAASRATASTRSWVVPHFEKMLYDNALLLARLRPLGQRRWAIGRREEIADFLLARAAHARGRLRVRAGRRQRGRRGHVLRLDAGRS